MAGEGKVLNLTELSQHRSRHDCWILINGKVYDVTKFLNDHPGGEEVLLSVTGKDATDEYEKVLGHSSLAKFMLDELYVGYINSPKANDTITTNPNQIEQNRNNTKKNVPELLLIKLLSFLVSLTILGLALCVRFYIKTTNSP